MRAKDKFPEALQAVLDKTKDLVNKELSGNSSVFKGKAAVNRMEEKPIHIAHSVILQVLNLSSDTAKSQGIKTRSTDRAGQCIIREGGKCLIRGRLMIEGLEMYIRLSREEVDAKANQITEKIREIILSVRDGRLGYNGNSES